MPEIARAFVVRVRAHSAAAVLCALAAISQAAVTPNPPVDQLVQQLGSEKPDDREIAQTQLLNLGDSIRPVVQDAAEHDKDPEVRSRAGAVLAELQDREMYQASLVTVHVKNAAAATVLEQISPQIHAQLLTAGPTVIQGETLGGPLTLDVDQKPFWEVMGEIAQNSRLCPLLDSPRSSNNRSMQLVGAPLDWLNLSPHQVVGPYWIGVVALHREQSLNLWGEPRYWDQFYVQVSVVPEPKLVSQLVGFTVLEAVDDAGQSLVAPARTTRMPIDPMVDSYTAEAMLSYPAHPGSKIAVLRGEVTLLLGQQYQQYRVDDVLTSRRQTNPIPDCAVKTTIKMSGPGLYSVTLAGSGGLTRSQWSMSDLQLLDDQGRAIPTFSDPHGRSRIRLFVPPSTFTISSLFFRDGKGLAGVPRTLIWNVPTSFRTVRIPVTFKDIPMIGG
jgi:hypothetical protein